MKPRQQIQEIERGIELPHGSQEYFAGYGVMGLPFSSGHVLALRCFPSTSVGAGYRSIWHRNPQGDWTFYQNAPPLQSCPRYFGNALVKAQQVNEIKIVWTGPNDFCVSIENPAFEWKVSLSTTPATALMNTMASLIPEPLWLKPGFLTMMGKVAGVMLGAGHVGMTGKTPNGQEFIANPKQIWSVAESTASLQGESFGKPGALKKQASLGDFWIPQRGIFAIGSSMFEAYDPAKHRLMVSSIV